MSDIEDDKGPVANLRTPWDSPKEAARIRLANVLGRPLTEKRAVQHVAHRASDEIAALNTRIAELEAENSTLRTARAPPPPPTQGEERVEAMRAKCEAIARDTIPEVSMHDYEDGFAAAAQQIADAVAALKDKP